MSKTSVVIAIIALLVGAGAIALQFVPQSNGEVDQATFDTLENRVASLETKPVTPAISIAYINAEDAFTVFTNEVQEERQRAFDKQEEIIALQRQYMEGAISKEEYEDTYLSLIHI